LFAALSSLGLPILNGFVGEYLILLGTYQTHWQWAAWAALGVILSACYLLWSYQRVFFGDVTHKKNAELPDTSARERFILLTMAVVTLWMGVGSVYITNRTAAASQTVLEEMKRPDRAYEATTPARRPARTSAAAPEASQQTPVERVGTR